MIADTFRGRFGFVMFFRVIAFVLFLAPETANARHTQDIRSIDSKAQSSTTVYAGPFTVRWVAINPLRYPDWRASDFVTSKAGPSLSTFTGSSASLPAIEQGAASPSPQPTATDDPDHRPPDYEPVDPDAKSDDDCGISALPGPPASPTISDLEKVNACYEAIAKDIGDPNTGILSTIRTEQAQAERITSERDVLESVIDIVLSDPTFSTMSASGSPAASPAGESEAEQRLTQLDQNIELVVIGDAAISPKFRERIDALLPDKLRGFASAKQLEAKITALEEWPSDRVAADLGKISAVQSYLHQRALTSTMLKVSRIPSVFGSDGCITLTSNANQLKNDVRVAPLSPMSCFTQLQLYQDALKARAAGTNTEKAYSLDRSRVTVFSTAILSRLTPSRFHYTAEENCANTNASRRDHVFTLYLRQDIIINDIAVCQSRLVASAGVAFSTLQQSTFATVPYNPYGGQKLPLGVPSPLPMGAGFIQATQTQQIRGFPVQLLNYKLADVGPNNSEGELFSTFGLGLTQSTAGTAVDFIAGGSVAFTRAAFLTFGAHLGQQNILSPGYKTGQFSVAAPQSTTRYVPGFTLVASYGGA